MTRDTPSDQFPERGTNGGSRLGTTGSDSSSSVWQAVLPRLAEEYPSNLFEAWIRPLQVDEGVNTLELLAPNPFFVRHINDKFMACIREIVLEVSDGRVSEVGIRVGSRNDRIPADFPAPATTAAALAHVSSKPEEALPPLTSGLNPLFTFDNFVPGKGSQLAHAGCLQAAENPGATHSNPLFIYGPTGLGKSHLMHAVGNEILRRNPDARVMCLTSERFIDDFITFRSERMDDFKRLYRSLDALLIDDIRFFSGKEDTQEELFHTLNALLEGSRQIIMTSDRMPKKIHGMDDCLKSRFAWGLSVRVDLPDKEARVAMLLKKSNLAGMDLPLESAHFVAEHVEGNVRELEGALNKVMATARFKGVPVTPGLVREALRDVVLQWSCQFTVENIQRVVAEYYRIPPREMSGKKRRWIAMALSRELTGNSYSAIGQAFGGRDPITVMRACDKVNELCATDSGINEDYNNLLCLLPV